jgi:hypothetical protein
MKILLKILFESEAEFMAYQQNRLPITESHVPDHGQSIQETNAPLDPAQPENVVRIGTHINYTDKAIRMANEQFESQSAKKHTCKYWNCKKAFTPKDNDPNALYCSSKCEAKDAKVQEQNEKLAQIRKESPVRRGRPPIRKDSQS